MGLMLNSKLYLGNRHRIWHYCPACKHLHRYDLAQPFEHPDMPDTPDDYPGSPKWQFNGNLALPSFSPSMLIYMDVPDSSRPWDDWIAMKERGEIEKIPYVRQTCCHYFLTDGKLQYCGDSPHALSGQTVELPDLPNPNYYGYPGA